MRPLLKPNQLLNLQQQASRNFTTKATLRRQVYGSNDQGDDALDPSPAIIAEIVGWLTSTPTPEGTLDSGSFVTVNTYRFDCDVSTDVQPRDFLDIGDNRYVVTDTTADETWPTMLSCSLRLRE
jgi:hypothetical protein